MSTPNPIPRAQQPPATAAKPDENDKNAEKDETSSGAPLWVQVGFAVGLTLLFIVLVAVMLASAKDSDTIWQKKVYIYGSVEAVVFTAIGWVFGREVKRSQVAAAQATAADAKQEAKNSAAKAEQERKKTEAAKDEAALQQAHVAELASAARIATLAPTAPAAGGPRRVATDVAFGDEPPPPAAESGISPQLTALRDLADRLHPPAS